MGEGGKELNKKNCPFIGGDKEQVNRVSYILSIGPIPRGYRIVRKCRTRTCVKPEHLAAMTPSMSVKQSFDRGWLIAMRGEANGNSKLTAENVLEIRRRKSAGTSAADLARVFGITKSNVWCIAGRKSWKHL